MHFKIIIIFILAGHCTACAFSQTARILRDVPVLCYHNILPSVGMHSPAYTCSISTFQEHLKILSDSGYQSISPEQLFNYLMGTTLLPEKPFLITFDDGHEEHFTIVFHLLQQYQFKGVFFVPTGYRDKNKYLTDQQIRTISDSGHVIAAHSFDHTDCRSLDSPGWVIQLTQPIETLENIINKKVEYFAYPYGTWNDSAISFLQQNNIKLAFQLGGKKSREFPLYTVRRLVVSGNWTPGRLLKQMRNISSSITNLRMVIDITTK